MATQQFMSGEDRAAQEEAELQAAEAAFNGTAQEPAQQEQAPQEQAQQEAPQEPSETDWEKRYKDLQSYHDKQTNELRDQLKAAGVEPTETDKVSELEKQLAELQADKELRDTQDLVAQAQEAVSKAHPDFVSVINSQEFAEWIKTQPQVYQDAVYADRPDAAMASDALTLFKVQSGFNDRQAATNQREAEQQAAMSVNGGHREAPNAQTEKQWTWNEIQNLSPSEYAKFEDEIDKALQEGRVH